MATLMVTLLGFYAFGIVIGWLWRGHIEERKEDDR